MLTCFSLVWLFTTPWTVAHQAPLSMGFSWQEHCSGLSCPLPHFLPDPEIEPMVSCISCIAGRFCTAEPSGQLIQRVAYLNPVPRIVKCTIYTPLHYGSGNPHYSLESESEVTQSCLSLCDPMDYSLPGFSVHGIFQARVLEWVAISFSRGSSWPRDQTQISCIAGRCFTLWAFS